MLTTEEITAMRATVGETLVDQATITRPVRVSDGLGGMTTSWATITTVACHLAPERTQGEIENEDHARVTSAQKWMVTMPAGTDARMADRLTINARTFEVGSVDAPRTWELHRRVHCTEVL